MGGACPLTISSVYPGTIYGTVGDAGTCYAVTNYGPCPLHAGDEGYILVGVHNGTFSDPTISIASAQITPSTTGVTIGNGSNLYIPDINYDYLGCASIPGAQGIASDGCVANDPTPYPSVRVSNSLQGGSRIALTLSIRDTKGDSCALPFALVVQ